MGNRYLFCSQIALLNIAKWWHDSAKCHMEKKRLSLPLLKTEARKRRVGNGTNQDLGRKEKAGK